MQYFLSVLLREKTGSTGIRKACRRIKKEALTAAAVRASFSTDQFD
jgi:hypothetical protein